MKCLFLPPRTPTLRLPRPVRPVLGVPPTCQRKSSGRTAAQPDASRHVKDQAIALKEAVKHLAAGTTVAYGSVRTRWSALSNMPAGNHRPNYGVGLPASPEVSALHAISASSLRRLGNFALQSILSFASVVQMVLSRPRRHCSIERFSHNRS